MNFSIDQVNGVLRIVVPGICTWLAAKGFNWLGDEGIQAEVAAVALAVAAVVWSYFTHSPVNTLKRAAKLDPGIRIDVPKRLSDKHPSIKELVQNSDFKQVLGQS